MGLTIQKLLNGVIFPLSGKNLKIIKNLTGDFWFRQIKNHDFIRFLVKYLGYERFRVGISLCKLSYTYQISLLSKQCLTIKFIFELAHTNKYL